MTRKKPVIVCIFAHPDDEAFGPGGTIAKYAKTHDVYILCATKGEAGQHYDAKQKAKIAEIREQEIKNAAAILGVKKVIFLGFKDGELCNSIYHTLANKIIEHLKKLKPEMLITFEPQGVSGHIDHIMVSMVTTYVFHKLDFIKTLLYHCVTTKFSSLFGKTYFIYFPPGYKQSDIDKVEDVSAVWNTKIKAMYAHDSQKKDIERIIPLISSLPKEENFLVVRKQ